MDNIEQQAYKLFSATFRKRVKEKLQNSGRGIWSGKLLDSLDVQLEGTGDDIQMNIYAESYMEFIDEGVNGVGFQKTKKGNLDKRFNSNKSVVTSSPYSFKDKKPPLKAISAWSISKGLNPYAVQNSIWRRGIKGIHFFESTLDEEYSKLADYIAEAKATELLNGFDD